MQYFVAPKNTDDQILKAISTLEENVDLIYVLGAALCMIILRFHVIVHVYGDFNKG